MNDEGLVRDGVVRVCYVVGNGRYDSENESDGDDDGSEVACLARYVLYCLLMCLERRVSMNVSRDSVFCDNGWIEELKSGRHVSWKLVCLCSE